MFLIFFSSSGSCTNYSIPENVEKFTHNPTEELILCLNTEIENELLCNDRRQFDEKLPQKQSHQWCSRLKLSALH